MWRNNLVQLFVIVTFDLATVITDIDYTKATRPQSKLPSTGRESKNVQAFSRLQNTYINFNYRPCQEARRCLLT